ncbi:MAG: glycosyltransferase family 2 protein, partial [Deltaproteobacteria bacterium]|nr:glycosyltransferase family 2 protein [Deltaproteobacteria bacterium]
MPTWLFISTFILLAVMILEIARLTPLLLKELRFEADFTLPPASVSKIETNKISVIIPAKDEASNIQATVESILCSTYKNLEIVLIDDRSQDNTWALMEFLRESDMRVKTVKIETLPLGWTGKTHAMSVGADIATGNILLFTDADAFFSHDLVARALSFFLLNMLDMFSLIPGFRKWGFLEKAIYPHMALGISYFFSMTSINDRESTAAVASGCFIMMSEKAYHKVGTWRSLRNQVTEDIAMAKAVKCAGMKLSVGRSDLIQTKPFCNILELVRFWRRTFYGGLENSPIKIIRLWLNYSPLLIPFGLLVLMSLKMEI